jgi:hypothetical protein
MSTAPDRSRPTRVARVVSTAGPGGQLVCGRDREVGERAQRWRPGRQLTDDRGRDPRAGPEALVGAVVAHLDDEVLETAQLRLGGGILHAGEGLPAAVATVGPPVRPATGRR